LSEVIQVDLSDSPLSDIALTGIYDSARAALAPQSDPPRTSERRSRSFGTPLDAVVGILTNEPSTAEALRVLAHRELSNLVAAAKRQDLPVSKPALQSILCAAFVVGSLDGGIVVEFAKVTLSGPERATAADAVALVTWLRQRTRQEKIALQVEALAVELLSEQIANDAAALSVAIGAVTNFEEISSVCDALWRAVKAHPELIGAIEASYGSVLISFLHAVNESDQFDDPRLQRAIVSLALLLYELSDLDLGDTDEWPFGGPERSYLRALGLVRKYNKASSEELDAWSRINLLQAIAVETFNSGQFESALGASLSLLSIATAAVVSAEYPDELATPITSWLLTAGTVGSESWRGLDQPLQGWALCMQVKSLLQASPRLGAGDGTLRLPEDADLSEVFSSYLVVYRNVLQHLNLNDAAAELAEEALAAVRSDDGTIRLTNPSLLVSMSDDLRDLSERIQVLEQAEALARQQMQDEPATGTASLAQVLAALAIALDSYGDLDRAVEVMSTAIEAGERAWSGLTEASAARLASLYTSAGQVFRRDPTRAVPLFQKAVTKISGLHGPGGARQAVETTVRAWSTIGLGELGDSVLFEQDLLRPAVHILLEGLRSGDEALLKDFQLLTSLYAHTLVSGSGLVGPDDLILLGALGTADLTRFGTRGHAHMILLSSMVEAFYAGQAPAEEQRFQNQAARTYLQSIGDRVIPNIFQPGPGETAVADVQQKPLRPPNEEESDGNGVTA
jgi:tetratricopeptide (TPR) repeat protein